MREYKALSKHPPPQLLLNLPMYCHCSPQGYKLAMRPPICHILPWLLSNLLPLIKETTVLSEVPDSKSAPVTKIK